MTLLRPSETTQTTTFFQPSAPHVFDRSRPQRWATFLRTLRFGISNNSAAKVGLGNTRIHRSAEQDFVLIVHGHHNEKFGVSPIEIRSKAVL